MDEAIVCPYCRMTFDEGGPPKIYCTACGMPHHEDCYQENGGCTVFGCPRAPADDPKVHVSYSDLQMPPGVTAQPQVATTISPLPSIYSGPLGLNAPGPTAGAAQPAPASTSGQAAVPPPTVNAQSALAQQPVPEINRQPKSRTTYIVLGILLGGLGAHNFYAGYIGRAVGQLCLSVFTVFYLAIVSWVWAIVEICIVDKDSAGIQFS